MAGGVIRRCLVLSNDQWRLPASQAMEEEKMEVRWQGEDSQHKRIVFRKKEKELPFRQLV